MRVTFLRGVMESEGAGLMGMWVKACCGGITFPLTTIPAHTRALPYNYYMNLQFTI
jgi:hypothetical protein